MVNGIESALVAQLAAAQQVAAVSGLKQAAQAQQEAVRVLTETVTASSRGQLVDLYA